MTFMVQKLLEIINKFQDKVLYWHVIFNNLVGKKMNNHNLMQDHKISHLFQEKIAEAHHKKSIEKYFILINKCLTKLNKKRDRLNFPKEAVISSISQTIQITTFKQ